MEQNQKQHFLSLIHDFRFGMLITHAERGQFHGRPMAIAEIDDGGAIWLMSDLHSDKVAEVERDGHVAVSMQEGQKFVSLTGTAELVRDRAKLRSIWNEAWKVWFPKGADDADLVLLKINPAGGEYWDNSGTNRVRYLYEAAKAYVQGTRPNVGDMQGKVRVDV